MQIGNLAFLENFYTDVTLLIPPAEMAAPVEAILAKPTVIEAVTTPAIPLALPVVVLPAVVANAPSPAPADPAAPRRPLVAPARLPEAALTAKPTPANQPVVAPQPAVAPLPTAALPPAQLTPFTTLGTNAQGVVLLVRLPPDQFIKLTRNVFLNKMLQALGLVLADVVLVNVESHLPVALSSLRRELAATQIVAFGRNLLDVTIRNTQIYEPVQFPQLGFAYLAAAEIEMVEYDVSLKKRLWPGLKSMFL